MACSDDGSQRSPDDNLCRTPSDEPFLLSARRVGARGVVRRCRIAWARRAWPLRSRQRRGHGARTLGAGGDRRPPDPRIARRPARWPLAPALSQRPGSLVAADPSALARQGARWQGPMLARLARCRRVGRSEEHTSELQSLMRISYAVFCLKKKTKQKQQETPRVRTNKSHA